MEITVPTPADGDYEYVADITDPAGNTGPVSDKVGFELDTTAPGEGEGDNGGDAAPILAIGEIDNGVINEADAVDGIQVEITLPNGAAEGDTIELRDGEGTVVGEHKLTETDITSGKVEITVPTPENDGDYEYVADITDPAGNTGPVSDKVGFELDTTAPEAPSIKLDNDSGKWGDDLLTNDGSFTVIPNGSDNSIEYKATDGTWSTTPPAVAEGSNSIVVREVDDAGNASGETKLDFVLDTNRPNPPTITLDNDSGNDNTDLLTNDGSYTVKPSELGNTIEYRAENGTWSTTAPTVSEGPNAIVVREVDDAGNVSVPRALYFDLDTTAPNAPSIKLDTDSGIDNGDLLTNDGKFTVKPSETGNSIEYKAADGTWSTTAPTVVEGNNTIVVREVDDAGNASGETKLDFVLDTNVDTPAITNITDDSEASDNSIVTIHGTGEPGAIITIYIEDGDGKTQQGTALVQPDGTWVSDFSGLDEMVNYQVTVDQTDAAGNTSEESDSIQYFNGDFTNTDNLDDYAFLGDGNDTFYLNDDDLNDRVVVDGGSGTDKAVLNSNLSDCQISVNEHGEIVIIDKDGDENIFRDFEEFQFKDDHKTVEELLTPEVTIIDDKNNNGILTKAELEGRVTATITLPPAATAGMLLLISINGQTEEYTLTDDDINAGSLTRETDAPANGDKVNVSAELSVDGETFVGSDRVTYFENNNPIAGNDSFVSLEDKAFVINVQDLLGNDSDLDNDVLSLISITNPSSGSAVINSDGDIEFTPAPNYSGDVTFDYTISDGKGGESSATVTVKVDAIADTPSLIIDSGSDWSSSTGFESAADSNNSSSYVDSVDGWTPSSGAQAIEVWNESDNLTVGSGGKINPNASEGSQFIELNASTNASMKSSQAIEKDIATEEGQLYTITLDAAPRPGYSSDCNSFEVVIDGVVVGSWSDNGFEIEGHWNPQQVDHTSLQWNELQFSFIGTGEPMNIELRANGTVHSSGRGMMIDNIVIEEHNGVQAGNEGIQTHIALNDYIEADLNDTDGSEVLSYEIANLPVDAFILVNGNYITPENGKVTLTAEQLSSGKIVLDSSYTGTFTLAVTAIATETSNGDTARSEPQFLDLIIVEPGTNTDPIDTSKVQGGDFADQITKGSVQSITPGVHGQTYITDDANVINSGAGNDHVASGAGNDIIHLGDSHTAGYDETQSAYDIADEERALFATGSDASKLNDQDLESFISGYSPVAHIDAAHAGAGDDHVFGEGGIDLIYGAEGDDYLDGGEGDDVLRGGLGDDILTGGSGNDILIGGLGDDILVGGAGEDIFKWVDQDADSGVDTIKDFTVGEDLIDLTEIISGFDEEIDMTDLLAHIEVSESGDDLSLSITDDAGKEHTIIVEGAIDSFGLENANFSNQSEVLTKLLNEQMFKLDDIT